MVSESQFAQNVVFRFPQRRLDNFRVADQN